MGIADICKALEKGAAGKVSFQNVKLSYKDGGKQQCLKFNYKINQKNGDFVPSEHDFPGSTDPGAFALQIGQALAADIKEKK